MTPVVFRSLLNRLKLMARPAGTGALIVFIGATLFLAGDWLKAFGPRWLSFRQTAAVLLSAIVIVYPVVILSASFGLILSACFSSRARQRAIGHTGRRYQSRTARWLLLCGTTLVFFAVAETGAAAWLGWIHRLPAMPTFFAQDTGADHEILITVIGESSALGVPYEDWVSVGAIVGRELDRLKQGRPIRVENLAEKGATLEAMHLKLARLTRRPDALIVYSGHNEFLARFSLSNRVAHYDDDRSGGVEPGLAQVVALVYRPS